MRTTLVTGGCGFIGSHLVEHLLDRGDRVVVFDNYNAQYDPARKRLNASDLRRHERNDHLEIYDLDLREQEKVRDLIASTGVEAVAHLAGVAGVRASVEHPTVCTQSNVLGTLSLLEACRHAGVDTVAFASSSSVYGAQEHHLLDETLCCDHPLTPYAASKRAAELLGYSYHHLHGIHFTALRFFTVYGPRNRPDMMASLVLDSIRNNTELLVYDGTKMVRDWTYVGDTVRGIAAALERPMGFEIINLGRGEGLVLDDFIAMIESEAGRRARKRSIPSPLGDIREVRADTQKAQQLLGYQATTPVDSGVRSLWKWYQGL